MAISADEPTRDMPAHEGEPFGVETASHALAEWGESEPTGDSATLDTAVTTDAMTDVGIDAEAARTDEPDTAAVSDAAADQTDNGHVPMSSHPTPHPAREALPQVPAPPPWVPEGPADPTVGA